METAQKILVTGAAGFIGMHTVLRLLMEGFDVVGLDNLNDYYDVNLKHARLAQTGIFKKDFTNGQLVDSALFRNYRFVKADLLNRQMLVALFESGKFDYVVNLAAQAGVRYSVENPQAYIDSNVSGFMNILDCCRQQRVRHLVYASTSSVYGLNTATPFQERQATEHPMSLYAATKKANEMMAHSYSHLFGLSTTGLRFFTVYGPWGRPDMALFLFTKSILRREPIHVYNYGDMTRDFTYVDDVVTGIVQTLLKPATPNHTWSGLRPETSSSSAPYRIFNVGNSKPVLLRDYIKAIETALNMQANQQLMPLQPGDLPATHADVDALREYIGYNPSISVEHGVEQFVQWYIQYYHEGVIPHFETVASLS